MAPVVLTFPHPLYAEMVTHVLSNPALEMCGLLAGRAGVVDRVWPVPNALQSPVAYRMDGPEFAAAMIGCDFEPLGIFHSHPAGPAGAVAHRYCRGGVSRFRLRGYIIADTSAFCPGVYDCGGAGRGSADGHLSVRQNLEQQSSNTRGHYRPGGADTDRT